jgi:hypothetical protein
MQEQFYASNLFRWHTLRISQDTSDLLSPRWASIASMRTPTEASKLYR